MSFLGQPKIKRSPFSGLCAHTERISKEAKLCPHTHTHTRTHTHTPETCFSQGKAPIKIKLSCSFMVLMLHFKYVNPNLGSKWTYLSIFNNLVPLGNHGILVMMALEKATRESESAAHSETAKRVCTRVRAQVSRCALREATTHCAEKASWLEPSHSQTERHLPSRHACHGYAAFLEKEKKSDWKQAENGIARGYFTVSKTIPSQNRGLYPSS
ncbi:hypothetical protein HJG60_009355 [Phyllostomus discolor]|uniref:Uncharacterized protein n=1 Tax=Phyllostomus discolor TaxID=89673 RepID=A0A833YKM6_9CHIR|nr:hypothetical protein HJG60_009355 [Phyllostomus discolor]